MKFIVNIVKEKQYDGCIHEKTLKEILHTKNNRIETFYTIESPSLEHLINEYGELIVRQSYCKEHSIEVEISQQFTEEDK